MRRPSFFVLSTLSLILFLLMACGDGLSGSATGRNAVDMEHLEDELSLVSENMAALNEENSGLMELIEANRAYSDDLVIRAEELSDTTGEEIQDSLLRDRASIQIASDESNRIVSELLELIKSDLEYLLMQSDKEVNPELERASGEDFNEILGGLGEIRYAMEEVTRPSLTLVEMALEGIDAANIREGDSLDWHLDLGSDSGNVEISETESSYRFEMWLWSEPPSVAELSIVSSDTGKITVSPATLTFTDSNWDSAQTVTLTRVDDTDEDGDQTTTITVTGVGDNWADDSETFTVVTEDADELASRERGAATLVSIPTFEILSKHPTLDCLNTQFQMFVDVFGLYVVAPSSAPEEYVIHSANVLAEYIDNDKDGLPDDRAVLDHLLGENFLTPVWVMSTREQFDQNRRGTVCDDGVSLAASMYYDEDEWAIGGIQSAGTWDTNLEEIWHIVSNGWYSTYPEFFGDEPSESSKLVNAMDAARGGRFFAIPDKYPDNAWYSYYDDTCDYGCQLHEYFYWITMANIDALDPVLTSKCADSAHEWNVCNQSELGKVDALAFDLLNNHGFNLPTNIPNGRYSVNQ